MEEYVIQRRCHISNKHLYIHLYIAKVHSIHIWLNMASAEFLHFGYLWLFPAHFPRGKGLVKLLFFTFLYPCYINPQDLAISREHVFFEPLPCTWRLGFSDFKLLRFTNFDQLRLPGMHLSDPKIITKFVMNIRMPTRVDSTILKYLKSSTIPKRNPSSKLNRRNILR